MKLFLSIPGVQGETTLASHLGEIDVISCDWMFGRALDANGLPTGGTLQRPLVITKLIDSASGYLGSTAAVNGTVPDGSFVAFCTEPSLGLFEVMRLTIFGGRVEEIQAEWHRGTNVVTERVRFSYTSLSVKTTKRDASGNVISTASYTFKPI